MYCLIFLTVKDGYFNDLDPWSLNKHEIPTIRD